MGALCSHKKKMLKISGAKLHTFDFRDYALMACAGNSENLLDKTTTLTDIVALPQGSGFRVDPLAQEWKTYLEEADVYDLTVVPGEGGKVVSAQGGTIVDNLTKETVTVKKFGKIPKDYRKAVFRSTTGDHVHLYVSASKVNSSVFHKVETPSWTNYCVNRAVAEYHFAEEKYAKNANVAEKKLKESKSRVVFKVSDSARNKIMAFEHKKHGVCAAIYLVDPKRNKRLMLTFGAKGMEPPTTNVDEHYHFTTGAPDDAIPGFVGNLAKHLLFASAKIAVAGGAELGTGEDKLSALYKAALPIVKELYKNKLFVGLAIEAVEL